MLYAGSYWSELMLFRLLASSLLNAMLIMLGPAVLLGSGHAMLRWLKR